MLSFFRVLRALAGFLFLLTIAAVITQLTYNALQADYLMRASMFAIVAGVLHGAFWLWVFLGLRYVINEIHQKEQGSPHPSLTKQWHL